MALAGSEIQDQNKLRGGYYTSPELAAWICEWAIRRKSDRVLEPSCGDGVFLSAAVERLQSLGQVSHCSIASSLKGIEVNPREAAKADLRLRSTLGAAAHNTVQSADFFNWWYEKQDRGFDVAVGNPPFIRYQNFPEEYRAIALDIMTQRGLKPNRLTNVWVPFVVAAAESLRPGGRLGFVLPAELLQVSYASQLRAYLVDKFASIDIITCNQLFFDGAEQEVVIMLADGARPVESLGGHCRVTMTEFDTAREIVERPPSAVLAGTQPKTVHHESEKWLKYLLTSAEIGLMRELRQSSEITDLGFHASVDVGVVTGKNDFFVMGREILNELGLLEHTVPLISRSKQLQGAYVGSSDWTCLAAAGDRVHLLHLAPLNGGPINGALRKYIRKGEAEGVHKGFKCASRSPWYAVPSVWEPHGFLLRQIYDFPRIVLNGAEATCTDTIHRLSCKSEPAQVIPNTYTYLTGASAEIEGRSYGGGMLALEPTEAERLLVPAQLCTAMSIEECDALVRSGRLVDLLEENSERVLVRGVGLSRNDCGMLRDIWNRMRSRRRRRGRGRRSGGGPA